MSPCSQTPIKLPKLSVRELEVLTWTARGKTSIQISFLLKIKEPTVKKHVKSACLKLNANNKTHAIAITVSLGLIAVVHPVQLQTDDA